MISFIPYTKKNVATAASRLRLPPIESVLRDAKDIMKAMIGRVDEEDDIEYAVTFSHGCLFFRIFDTGRYYFTFPEPLTDDDDPADALRELVRYMVREEVPMRIVGIPICYLKYLEGFRHMTLDADDFTCDSYSVLINTECELCDELPEEEGDSLILTAITEEDIPDYARLCRDEEVNRYWGYDYREDKPDASDSYFYETAKEEFARGSSATFAILVKPGIIRRKYMSEDTPESESTVRIDRVSFAGEATLYAFDGKGNAQMAIRLLPEFQGLGLASESAALLGQAAREMGIICLEFSMAEENAHSLYAFRHYELTREGAEPGTLRATFPVVGYTEPRAVK